MEKTSYAGWNDCYRMSNGEVELVALADVGPRIIRFGFVGGDNEFFENKSQLGKVGGDQWRIYGGHRLWAAPEASPRSYFPDNRPLEATVQGDTLKLTAPPELDPSFKVNTGLQKEMEIAMHADGHVTVLHRITNVGLWPVELAPWALSVMAPNGRAIVPAPDPRPHPQALLPVRSMAVWSYTNMADPRWIWGLTNTGRDPSRFERCFASAPTHFISCGGLSLMIPTLSGHTLTSVRASGPRRPPYLPKAQQLPLWRNPTKCRVCKNEKAGEDLVEVS